ncbi:MAG: hypothetical protein GF418_06190 [Chitinivibrionales bacterium]|nr:hypothetical protein [Chitinivibrionales bacterium]MBD3395201.1 hypothetical protein [Chitinivibrionales bacterium]
MNRNSFLAPAFIGLIAACSWSADIVAVFPAQGVNTDQSFVDAFGMLLASKYRKISGKDVLPPTKAGRAIGTDSSLVEAARELNASEYLEIEAVGLYLSRKERARVELGEGAESKTIVVRIDNDDDDDDDDDQDLLDNHKTVVTVTRRDASTGGRIHTVEMTLVTYGDIEESTDRIAEALFKKVSVEEVLGMHNVTRREGMGYNKLFVDNLKGVKIGFIYPLARNAEIVSIVSIGYNHRFDSEKFFMEFGAGGRLPTRIDMEEQRCYGGPYLQIGGSYYFLRGIFGLHGGLGLSPHFNMVGNEGIEVGLVPYIQFGGSFPRNSKMQAFLNVKAGQNVMPIITGRDPSSWSSATYPPPVESHPTEVGIELGLGF